MFNFIQTKLPTSMERWFQHGERNIPSSFPSCGGESNTKKFSRENSPLSPLPRKK